MDDLWLLTAPRGRRGELVDLLAKRADPSALLLAVEFDAGVDVDVDVVVFNPDGAAPLSLPDDLLAGPPRRLPVSFVRRF